jgi:hypothetical protein
LLVKPNAELLEAWGGDPINNRFQSGKRKSGEKNADLEHLQLGHG